MKNNTFTRKTKRKDVLKENYKILRLANIIDTDKSKNSYGVRALRINGLWIIAGGSHSLLLLLLLFVCVII